MFKKGMKVRYIGEDCVAYERGLVYEVLDIDEELGWPELKSSGLNDEAFILPPEVLEEVEEYKYFRDLDNGSLMRISDSGATESYNFIERQWEKDYVRVPKMFIGEIDVEDITEEEVNKIIGL